MKRLPLIVCVAVGILLFNTSPAQANFSDVAPEHGHSKAINYVEQQGIVRGYADGTFRPDAFINRAEFTKIVLYAADASNITAPCPIGTSAGRYPDVPEDSWFFRVICLAGAKGIVRGYPDGTFRPSATINYAEAAKIASLAFHLEVRSDEACLRVPADGVRVHGWYCPYINAIERSSDFPPWNYPPRIPMTRGGMAELIYRLRVPASRRGDGENCAEARPGPEYTCMRGCGSPVGEFDREDRLLEEPIQWNWMSPENFRIRKRNGCPVCLAYGTLIATPQGPVAVQDVKEGTLVWSMNEHAHRVAVPILAVSRTPVSNHRVVHLILSDGRSLRASAGHPTAQDQTIGSLRVGDALDGAVVIERTVEAYDAAATYDLLPESVTQTYWANGVLLKSTLN